MATHGHDLHAHGSDKGAALAGLFGGAIFLFAVVYALVLYTNSKYAGHAEGGSAPAAAQTAH